MPLAPFLQTGLHIFGTHYIFQAAYDLIENNIYDSFSLHIPHCLWRHTHHRLRYHGVRFDNHALFYWWCFDTVCYRMDCPSIPHNSISNCFAACQVYLVINWTSFALFTIMSIMLLIDRKYFFHHWTIVSPLICLRQVISYLFPSAATDF